MAAREDLLTFGVEEEFLLLDPGTGLPVARAEEVRTAAQLQPALTDGEVQLELLQAQIEVATPICHQLEEVGGHLLRMRHALGEAAEAVGCRLAATGAAPYSGSAPVPVTPKERYRTMRTDAPRLTDEQLICGMHVHVAVPERHLGVAVLNRLRPWLPVLVAMAANSPVWGGTDTGFASWRTVLFDRWPVTGVPPLFADAAEYDLRIKALHETGIIRDTGQLYWQARLSERYPTVEIRAMDVQLRADEAVLLAGVVRALVVTAVRQEQAGLPLPDPYPESLAGADWHAARHGLGSDLHDPLTGRRREAGAVLGELADQLLPALDTAGDTRQVLAALHRLLRDGNGAARQRQALRPAHPEHLIDLITDRTA